MPVQRHLSVAPRYPSLLLVGFCLWLVLLPLPLGGNRIWASAVAWPPLLALTALAVLSGRGRAAPMHRWLSSWPGGCLAIFLLVIGAQLWPGSPAESLVRFRTENYALTAIACACAAWLVATLVRDEVSMRWLLGAMVAAGLVQSIIAVSLLATGQVVTIVDTDLGGERVAQGTFPNRNHLAFFLNLSLASGIGLLAGGLRAHRPQLSWRQRLRDWLEVTLSGKARLRLLLVLIVIALILTRSRAGNATFFLGLLLALGVYAFHVKERRRGALLLVTSLLVVDMVLIGAWVGVDKVMDRLQQTALLESGRVDEETLLREALGDEANDGSASGPGATARVASRPAGSESAPSVEVRIRPATEALALVRQSPLFGTGGGSFYLMFMPLMPEDLAFYDHAHNDYIELATDMGLPALAALLVFAAGAALKASRLIRDRRNPVVRSASISALMAFGSMAAHSVVDFSLQIQSIAVTATVMMMLPFAAARIPSSTRSEVTDQELLDQGRGSSTQPASALRWAMATITAAALCGVAWHGWRLGMADYLATGANRTIATWESLGVPPTVENINAVLRTLETSIELAPSNADYREGRASLFYARAVAPGRTVEERVSDYAAALAGYREAAARSPYSSYVWGNLMLVKFRLGEIDPEFFYAFERAVRLGPYEPSVQRMVVGVGFPLWERIPPAAQALVIDTIRRGWAKNRRALLEEAATARNLDTLCGTEALPMQALCKTVRRSATQTGRSLRE